MKSKNLIAVLVLTPSLVWAGEYFVRQTGMGYELVTPNGSKLMLGEYAPNGVHNFRVEVPLNELAPPPKKEERKPDSALLPPVEDKKAPEICPKPEPKAVNREFDDSDKYILEANQLYNQGKFYESSQVVEELLRKKPEMVRGWIMKGSLMYVMKQKELAFKAWNQAKALDPENSEVNDLIKRYQ